MSKIVRRVAAAACALSMGVALAACSNSEKDSTEPAESSAVTTQASSASKTDESAVLSATDVVVRATTSSQNKAEDGTYMTGIFGKFSNNTDVDQTIVAFSSDTDAKMHQIHEIGPDGMMREKQGGLTIKAGETAELKPGGEHLMLMGMSTGLEPGDTVNVTLELAGGQKVELGEVDVRDISSGEENYGDLANGDAMQEEASSMTEPTEAVTDPAATDAAAATM